MLTITKFWGYFIQYYNGFKTQVKVFSYNIIFAHIVIWIQERLNNKLASNIEMLRVVEKIQRTDYILTQRKECSKDQQTRYNFLSHGLLSQ